MPKSRSLRKEIFSRHMRKEEIKRYQGNMDFMLAWKDFVLEQFDNSCIDTTVPWDFEYFFTKSHPLYNSLMTYWGKDYEIYDEHSRFIVSKEFRKMIDNCDKRFIVSITAIHIMEYDSNGSFPGESHANGLIIDNEEMKVYRFEPHGEYDIGDNTYDRNKRIDNDLRKFINFMLGEKYTFVPTLDYCPAFGVQAREYLADYTIEGEYEGYCGAWSMMFLHEQIMNPHKSPKQIADKLMKFSDMELAKRVRRYAQFLVREIRANPKFKL